MLRTIFMIGLFAVLGLIALRVVFGILPALIGLFVAIAWFAIKIAAVGFVIYLLIRVFSPDTARRLREKWSGPAV
jgi:cytosine/uracil/thiamine/allantoin permease